MAKKGGYNRYNLLNKIEKVNKIYLEHSKKGVPAEYIFTHYIRPNFFISRTTFFNYLTIPYKKQKAELEDKQIVIPFNFD
ncbi:MAG: hypothetical protein LBN95_01985 [Prevotellaceae bacterium]|jgi:hypothetical protein|nr:hypothetical protein [Prevotellaceae bacterium]